MLKTKTKTPVEFTDPALRNTYPLTKRESRQLAKLTSSSLSSSFRPFIMMMLGILLLFVCGINTVVSAVVDGFSSYTRTVSTVDYTESWEGISLSEPVWFRDGDNLVASVMVTKTNPYVETHGGEVTFQLYDEGILVDSHEYVYLPWLPYGEQTVWLSTSFTDIPDNFQDISIKAGKSSEYIPYQYDIEEVNYLLDDSASNESLLKAWQRSQSSSSKRIEVLNDSVASQSGTVTFNVSAKNDETSYLYGSYNILFKNNGEVVFADLEDFYFDEETSPSAGPWGEVTYSAPFTLPAYDEVEITLLS